MNNTTEKLEDGWYRVTVGVRNPPKGWVSQYDEWVCLVGGEWDLSGMGDVFIKAVLRREDE